MNGNEVGGGFSRRAEKNEVVQGRADAAMRDFACQSLLGESAGGVVVRKNGSSRWAGNKETKRRAEGRGKRGQ